MAWSHKFCPLQRSLLILTHACLMKIMRQFLSPTKITFYLILMCLYEENLEENFVSWVDIFLFDSHMCLYEENFVFCRDHMLLYEENYSPVKCTLLAQTPSESIAFHVFSYFFLSFFIPCLPKRLFRLQLASTISSSIISDNLSRTNQNPLSPSPVQISSWPIVPRSYHFCQHIAFFFFLFTCLYLL